MQDPFRHRYASINGIQTHFVELGDGPPVILCHGFPHTWYIWHRQMRALAAAGFRAIAPDMRGMGETEAPSAIDAYGVPEISADLTGLLDYLELERAVFLGLDFGVFAAYDLAFRQPQRLTAVIGLQNPTVPHTPGVPPLEEYAAMGKDHFLHINYFKTPGIADRDLHASTRDFLHRVYYALSGEYDFAEVMSYPPDSTYLDALPAAPPLPWPWLSEAELEVLVKSYENSGFTGGLNWYRSMDIKWRQRVPFEGKSSQVPTYFIGSENDLDLAHFHGEHPIDAMRRQFPNLRRVEMLPAVGHLMHLEATTEVNQLLLEYLRDIAAVS